MRVFCFGFCVVALLVTFVDVSFASASLRRGDTVNVIVGEEGSIGVGLSWVLDNSLLNISGTGTMLVFRNSSSVPWHEYRDLIETVWIADGVKSVGDYAFTHCVNLKNLTIPESVRRIGNNAFFNCTSLPEVKLPDDISVIGENAFAYCSSLTEVVVPGSLETVSFCTFCLCLNLEKVTISEGVSQIGELAFGECFNLVEVNLPSGLVAIRFGAFYHCSSLIEVTIPSTVTEIELWAFTYCYSLTAINVEDGNQQYNSVDGVLFSDESLVLVQYPIGKDTAEYTTPEDTLEVYANAFTSCEHLKKVFLTNIIDIGEYAFQDCTQLSEVTFSELLDVIGERAFEGCVSLSEVTIPDETKKVGGYAFHDCTNLATVLIGDTLQKIEDYTFANCVKLSSIIIGASVSVFGNYSFYNCTELREIEFYNTALEVIGGYAFSFCNSLTKLVLPEGVVSIRKHAFSQSALQELAIPATTTEIDEGAFFFCDSIRSVNVSIKNKRYKSNEGVLFDSGGRTLLFYPTGRSDSVYDVPSGTTAIGDYSFQSCTSLAKVVLHGNIKNIGDHAFYNCTGLAEIVIPDSVETIEDFAFSGCISLANLTVGSGVQAIGSYAFSNCPLLRNFTIPDSVAIIGDGVFESCTGLVEVVINDALLQFGACCFLNCSSLTSIIIPDEVRSIPDSSFQGCTSLTRVVIGNRVGFIGNNAFYRCTHLSEVSLPDVVQSVGLYAFLYCSSLTDISFGKDFAVISDYAFYGCSNLTKVTIPSKTVIGNHAFQYCSSLAQVTIGSEIESIGDYSFSGCTSLTEVTIPDSVITVGNSCFQSCHNLSRVVIGKNVEVIGNLAFSSCFGISEVMIPASVRSIGVNAFTYCSKMESINVEEGNQHYKSVAGVLFNKDMTTLIRYPDAKDNTSYVIPDSVTSIQRYSFSFSEYLSDVTIPESVLTIGDYAFEYCKNLTSVFYQGSHTIWALGVFDMSENLTNICVSPDYESDMFCGMMVNSSNNLCSTFQGLFDHCYRGTYIDSIFTREKRINATAVENLSFGCVLYHCQNHSEEPLISYFCEDRVCYNSKCNDEDGKCIYEKNEEWQRLSNQENHCYEAVCNGSNWTIVKRQNATEWESKSDECMEYVCNNATGAFVRDICKSLLSDSSDKTVLITCITVPLCFLVVCAVIIILLLRFKVFANNGIHAGENTELTMTMKGESKTMLLKKKIGKGAFGTVWLAESNGSELAIKEIDRDVEGNENEYEKEMSIMSELDSPYVVRVLGSLVTKNSYFIGMEYVPLGSLTKAFSKCVFSPFMRCRFMLDVSRGMEYLHSQGIIHRDLKPGNVLVASLDPYADFLCKITDFGESRKGMENTRTMTMTRGIGTPYYMSPEMLRGDEKYSRAIDVYSYGIMGVELWNECLPYSECQFDTPVNFILHVLNGGRPRIRSDCPGKLAALFENCWDTDRNKRPPFTAISEIVSKIVDNFQKTLPPGTNHVVMRHSKKRNGGKREKSPDTGFGEVDERRKTVSGPGEVDGEKKSENVAKEKGRSKSVWEIKPEELTPAEGTTPDEGRGKDHHHHHHSSKSGSRSKSRSKSGTRNHEESHGRSKSEARNRDRSEGHHHKKRSSHNVQNKKSKSATTTRKHKSSDRIDDSESPQSVMLDTIA